MTVPCCEPSFWLYIIIVVCLVVFAGLMSGLTLGLMSLSVLDLEVLQESGSEKDKRHATRILPIVRRQHLLLCTLLLGGALAMEALPIFLDELVPTWSAILISVTLILVFGEILPQAVCTRYGLAVGATLAPLVRLLVFVAYPVAWPISKVLDWMLGKDHAVLFRRQELQAFVTLHSATAGKGGVLTHDETTIIAGALTLAGKTAEEAMTPLENTFALSTDTRLDFDTMRQIMAQGHSRVPLFSGTKSNIVGMVLTKSLLTVRPEDATPITRVPIRRIPRVHAQMPLYDILNEFQKGHSHMAIVVQGTGAEGVGRVSTTVTIDATGVPGGLARAKSVSLAMKPGTKRSTSERGDMVLQGPNSTTQEAGGTSLHGGVGVASGSEGHSHCPTCGGTGRKLSYTSATMQHQSILGTGKSWGLSEDEQGETGAMEGPLGKRSISHASHSGGGAPKKDVPRTPERAPLMVPNSSTASSSSSADSRRVSESDTPRTPKDWVCTKDGFALEAGGAPEADGEPAPVEITPGALCRSNSEGSMTNRWLQESGAEGGCSPGRRQSSRARPRGSRFAFSTAGSRKMGAEGVVLNVALLEREAASVGCSPQRPGRLFGLPEALGWGEQKGGAEEVIGIITMEDVIQELLQEEIYDETDVTP